MTAQQPVRVGDRYIFDDLRITVSEVRNDHALINCLQPDTGTKWTKQQSLPFPGGFIKVYSAQPEFCESCHIDPPAMGMAYCDDCLDVLASVAGGPPSA